MPSNWRAFVEGDKAKMRGDEEIATHKGSEAPCDWYGRATRGYTPLDVPAHATWRALLRSTGLAGLAGLDVAVGAVGADSAGSHVLESRELETVSSALTLGDVVSLRSSRPSKLALGPEATGPGGALTRMFAALGLDVEDAREVVRICIREWRDVNAADEAALAYLRSRAAAD